MQFALAQMATEIEAARLMVYNAARIKDAGQPYVKEAAMTKLFASQVAERVASLSVEIFGGNGFVRDYPAEKFYRDAKVGKIYEGTSNMQLMTIAKQVLRGGSKTTSHANETAIPVGLASSRAHQLPCGRAPQTDAVGNSDSVVGVAGQLESRQRRQPARMRAIRSWWPTAYCAMARRQRVTCANSG